LKRLYRNTNDKKIAGVCSGLAEHFEIDPVITRLIFIATFFFGAGPFLYFIAWFIIPEKE